MSQLKLVVNNFEIKDEFPNFYALSYHEEEIEQLESTIQEAKRRIYQLKLMNESINLKANPNVMEFKLQQLEKKNQRETVLLEAIQKLNLEYNVERHHVRGFNSEFYIKIFSFNSLPGITFTVASGYNFEICKELYLLLKGEDNVKVEEIKKEISENYFRYPENSLFEPNVNYSVNYYIKILKKYLDAHNEKLSINKQVEEKSNIVNFPKQQILKQSLFTVIKSFFSKKEKNNVIQFKSKQMNTYNNPLKGA